MALSCKAPLRINRAGPVRASRPARVSTVQTKAALSSIIAVGGSTIAFLSLRYCTSRGRKGKHSKQKRAYLFYALQGRFVFLPYQRREAAYDDVGPKTTGTTYFDKLQQPSSFTLSSKDPAGFTSIDVLGWGALGHAFGYFLLAATSLNDAGISAFPR